MEEEEERRGGGGSLFSDLDGMLSTGKRFEGDLETADV